MRKRLKLIARLASFGSTALLLASIGSTALLSTASFAAEQPGPQVSANVAKPLKAAQDAMREKKLDEALARTREAQAASGEKSGYDNFVINVLLFQIFQQKQDMGAAIPMLSQAAQSQYASAEQQRSWLKNIALYYFQQKDYARALEAANQAVKHGASDSDTLRLIAKSQYLSGNYKEAAVSIQQVVAKQDKPDEESLKLMWQFDLKANDQAGASRAVEKLVSYYPKPEYWANALASLVNADTKDAHLQLNVYRLMSDVGVLKRGGDYAEMADIALDQGYPGETQAVLQKAFAQKRIYRSAREGAISASARRRQAARCHGLGFTTGEGTRRGQRPRRRQAGAARRHIHVLWAIRQGRGQHHQGHYQRRPEVSRGSLRAAGNRATADEKCRGSAKGLREGRRLPQRGLYPVGPTLGPARRSARRLTDMGRAEEFARPVYAPPGAAS